MQTSEIKVERDGHVVVITLNRPEALNALTMTLTSELYETCAELNDDPDCRAVVITGAGRGFCSGFDLKKGNLADPRRFSVFSMLRYHEHKLASLRIFAKPTIAAVNGVAAGGGLGLALSCDLRIAGASARFSAIFANIGMSVQDAVGAFLPQVVGIPKALEMIYTAKMVHAEEALKIGLVNEAVADDQLMPRAMELAQQIAAGPPVALAMSKQVVYRSWGKPMDEQLAMQNLGTFLNTAYASEDVAEAIDAFRNKRKPKFTGPKG
ncbi:MAG: enoyl-CoA hydratase/isomerase family protein [Gammaproteobacteria bacterium]